jgi:hypothetical protein
VPIVIVEGIMGADGRYQTVGSDSSPDEADIVSMVDEIDKHDVYTDEEFVEGIAAWFLSR